jgi:hypothetical protein
LPVVLGVLIFALILGAVWFYDRSSRARALRILGVLGQLVLRFPAWSAGIAVALILGGFYLLGPKDEYVPPPPPPTTTEAPEPRPVGWYENACGNFDLPRNRQDCGVQLRIRWCEYVSPVEGAFAECFGESSAAAVWKGAGWVPSLPYLANYGFYAREHILDRLGACETEVGAGPLCEPSSPNPRSYDNPYRGGG